MKQYIFIQAIYRHGETLPEGLGTYLVETEHDGAWLLDTVAEVDKESVVTLIPCKDYGADTYFRHGLFLYHFDEEKGHLVTVETYVQILGIIDPIAVDPETEEPVLPEEDGYYLIKNEAEEITSVINVYTEEDERKWKTETPSKENVYVYGPKGYVYDEVTGKFNKAPIAIKHLQDVVAYDDIKKEFERSPMFFPLTHVRAVIDSKGNNVGSLLDRLQDNIDASIVYLKRYAEAQAKAGVSADNVTIGFNLDDQLQVIDGGISTAKLANGAVTADKLANGAITGDAIGDGAISTEKINNDAVTADKLADGAVSTAKMQDNAVNADKIADGSVTTDKVEDKAITKDKLADEVRDRIDPVLLKADVNIVDEDNPTIVLKEAVSQKWMDSIDRRLELTVTSAGGMVLEICVSTDYYTNNDDVVPNVWNAFFNFMDYIIRVDHAGNATIAKKESGNVVIVTKDNTVEEVQAAYNTGKQVFLKDEDGMYYNLVSHSLDADNPAYIFTLVGSDGIISYSIVNATGWTGDHYEAADADDLEDLQDRTEAIENLIPDEAAPTSNKLADKKFVTDLLPVILEYDSGEGEEFEQMILTALASGRPVFMLYNTGLYAVDGVFHDDQDTRITFHGDYQDKAYAWMWSLRFGWSMSEASGYAQKDSFAVTKFFSFEQVKDLVALGIPIYMRAGNGEVALQYVGIIDDKYTFSRTYMDEDGALCTEISTLDENDAWAMEKVTPSGSDPLKKITYSELKTLRDGGKLVPGQQYRITDYHCTTAQENTQSADHQFDIIVTADDEKTLNENARAIQHEGDTYFANCNLAAWELKYSLENDANIFDWADATNGKGVIYFMKDEWNNECPYDFKNIMYYRKWNTYYGLWSTIATASGGVACYTFSPKGSSSTKSFTDLSLSGGRNKIYSNSIGEYIDSGQQLLNNICFFGTQCYNNTIAGNCYNNTFGNGCYNNTFGNECYNNMLTSSFYNNTIAGKFYNNFIKAGYGNTFGYLCFSNTIGGCMSCFFDSSFQNNTLGDGCQSNTFGPSCTFNNFGSQCRCNTLGPNCESNWIDSYCNCNIFGSYCKSNKLGAYCESNIFGNYCEGNVFAKDGNRTAGDYFHGNKLEAGVSYCIFNNTETASSSQLVKNYYIKSSVVGTTSSKILVGAERNRAYDTTVALNSSGELKIYCEADLAS